MPLLFFVLGLIAGSFGNVLIHRLPSEESLWGRSHCPHCGKALRPLELIPLLSFAFQRGRCAHCKNAISWQYPIVELSSGLIFLLAQHVEYWDTTTALLLGLALWLLFLIAIIDGRTRMIPDSLSVALIVIGALYAHLTNGFGIDGVVLGAGFFGVQWLVSSGRWLGSGDIILGAAIGALLSSWKLVVLALFWAYILGALWALLLLSTQRAGRKSEIPFGPFLALGAALALLGSDQIISLLF